MRVECGEYSRVVGEFGNEVHYDGEYSRSEETVDDTLETGGEQKFALFDDVDEAETFVDGEEDEEEEGDHQDAEEDIPLGL